MNRNCYRHPRVSLLVLGCWIVLFGLTAVSKAETNSTFSDRTAISGQEIVLSGTFPPAPNEMIQTGTGVTLYLELGQASAWWSFTNQTNGTLILVPEGTVTNANGSPAAYGFAANRANRGGSESFEWLVHNPAESSADGSAHALTGGRYPSWVRCDIQAGVPCDFALFGSSGSPFVVRARFSVGAMIVLQPPPSVRVELGGTALISAYAAGPLRSPRDLGPAWTNQWFKDGIAIEGATNGFLQLTNVSANDAASYTLAVGVRGVGETSHACRLEIIPPEEFSRPVALRVVAVSTNGVLLEASSRSALVGVVATTNTARWPELGQTPDRWTTDALPPTQPDSSSWSFVSGQAKRSPLQFVAPSDSGTALIRMPRPAGPGAFFRAWPHRPLDPICHAQMQRLRWASIQAAHDFNLHPTSVTWLGMLAPYAGNYNTQVRCPKGGTYSVILMSTAPTCSIYGHGPWAMD